MLYTIAMVKATRKVSLSFSGAAILQALAHDYRYGFDVMDVTGLPSGTVYPALRRLEEAGLVVSSWEDEGTARNDQRPARKYYQLTAGGRTALSEAVSRYRTLERAITKPRKKKPSLA
jgi:DNA-binding PadR family transcriptional regulator